ncbi:MAG: hypothetical protein ACXAC7_07960 [Candidatus Hodarchaeales archaeon]|jgi:hypothetical protein
MKKILLLIAFLLVVFCFSINSQTITFNQGLQTKIVDYSVTINFWLEWMKYQPAEVFDTLVAQGYMGKQGANYYFNVSLKEEFDLKDEDVKCYWQSDTTLKWLAGRKIFAWYKNDIEPRDPINIYYQEYKIQVKEKINDIKLSYPKLKEYKSNGKNDTSDIFGFRKGSVIKFADRKKPPKDKEPPVRNARGRRIR